MDGGFFPNAGAWNSWYHDQVAQQSENVPADQASVEEQPDGLQLSASDEPETSPEQARGVRRVDVGSMRQTLQSDLQSGRFISGRHSVDFPGASIDHPAGVTQSSLRDGGFASMRYTAPNENASVKGRHSWLSRAGSKLKSGLRSIGGGGRKKTSGPSNEQKAVWSHNNPSADLNREDAELIEWYKDQLTRDGSAGRVVRYASMLRRLSRALAAKGQLPFSGRLDDPELDAEARAIHMEALASLNGLRKLKGLKGLKGEVHSADAELIEWYKDQLIREGANAERAARGDVYLNVYTSSLRRLSRALAAKGQPPFAGRLDDPALNAEARAFNGNNVLGALNGLRKLKGFAIFAKEGGDPLYNKDKDLIQRFEKVFAGSQATLLKYSSRVRAFSRWCFANNRGAIADRLNDPSLFDDANALPDAQNVKSALRALHRVQDQLLVQQQSVDAPPRFSSQRRSDAISPIDLSSSPEEPQQVDISRQGPSGLSLGREEWLGDEHILADFTHLQHELERDNPILAGRTRFVDPLIAHQLREGAHNDMRGALQRVLYDRYGNDTAEFLFLPVNDASGTNRGTHWSLLLVDRRDRQRPVAYHYDSLGGHNDNVAAMLATRLNASQYAASIGQQRNGYDCGVFVVDGTRELVRRLAEEWQSNLWNLDNVVADRGELQRRLSNAPGNARANDPAYQAGPSTRSVDSTEFWREVDQAGQPAADSWNTANFWQGGQAPAYGAPSDIYAGLESFVDLHPLTSSPSAQSVNQPSPPPWEHTEASIFGATAHMPPPPPDLGEFVGPGWVHGKRKQRAPEDLMRGMHWHDLLPSADRHQTNIMINGRRYTAQLGASGKQNDIYIFLR
ncbi:hypothetical protein ABIA00_000187 [Bradyrhizobium ottawaense]|uniref:Ulp1 family isopeptidase n=1 Tax=Bradyrhizobium ottawaense TaxID=931866 RepID=UPI0038362852